MEEQIKEIKKMAERNYVLISKNTKNINDNVNTKSSSVYVNEIDLLCKSKGGFAL